MQVDNELLKKLEKLSFLKVSDDKREDILSELSEIVNFVDNLSELDTDGIDNNFAMSDNSTQLREDTVVSSASVSEDILKNAPNSGDNFFIVPKIID